MRQKRNNIGSSKLVFMVAVSLSIPLGLPAQGMLATIYSPGQTVFLGYASCYPRVVVNGVVFAGGPGNTPISVSVSPQPMTNGHLHEGPSGYPAPIHPFSKLSSPFPNTTVSSNGQTVSGTTDGGDNFPVYGTTTLVGQQEVLSATCSGVTTSNAYSYIVGYGDLSNAGNPAWIPIGGNTTGHGSTANNQFMTQATAAALAQTATAWSAANPKRNCNICTNDAALPYGGKFDITAIVPYGGTVYPADPVYGTYHPWSSPHQSHDRGSAVDIAASSGGCQYPVNPTLFLLACKANGFNRTSSINEGNHVHCNSLDPATYPN